MTVLRQSACRKICAAIVAATLAFEPLAVHAATITPTLAQVPIQGLNPVKPNIMLTMDDSGSMGWDFLPDYTGYAGTSIYHCRDSRTCGDTSPTPLTGSSALKNFDPPVRSSDYNRVFYDGTDSYTPAKKADGTDLPCEGSNTACSGPWTAVYVNGYAGYPGANAGGTINLTTGYPDTLWCRGSAPTTTQKQTADDANGTYCRRNGRPYAKTTVSGTTTSKVNAGYNYPNNTATCTTGEVCKFTNPITYNGAPYYYTISKVQFCSAKDAAGWGTSPCSSNWDATTYKYVRYGTSGSLTFDPTAFTRVDILSTGILVNGVSAANPSGRTYAQEMTNFTLWYSFYRTRVQAMKGASGIAFSALDQNSRVGLHTLRSSSNANGNAFLNVVDFTTANKTTWFTKLYAVNVGGGTPLPDAMWRIGEYFSGNLAASGLPSATDPLDATTGKCQPNYHLLSTDGYWNDTLNYASRGKNDTTVPSLSNLPGNTGFTPNANFPRPYYDPSATTDSLADLAMYYWIRDIRPSLNNNVKDSVAPWQHVNLYSLSIGARGSVSFPDGINAITAGTANWPAATGAGGPEAVDDLWHAAVNTRGKYFNADNSRQLAESLVAALADFTDQSGTGAGVGIAGSQLSTTNQYAYKTSYEPGMWGDVKKYAINISTGVLPVDASGNPVNPPVWSAATQLDAQAAVVGTVKGWDTQRRIVTINDSTNTAVPFRLANLSSSQQSSLTAGWSIAPYVPTKQAVLDYLRGDQSNEGLCSTCFRSRSHILGDIVYSGAVPVGAPNAPFYDSGATGSPNPGYNAFKTAKALRAPTVYVGANDGMLHAFNDTASNGGTETWAFIPKALFSGGDPNDSAHASAPAFQLGALAYRRGGIPMYSHKFYVNATPRVWDVDFKNTNTSTPPTTGNDWRTILVGGLGVGGRAIYALDVTDPVALPPPAASSDTETTAASKVLWEYTEANLGYVYDAPTLVKTYKYGWVVLVASGYNNPTGKGYLYVLDPKTGSQLQKIGLPGDTGTDTSPTGLSTIRAFTASRQNPYVLQAYGGDLKGNVWRFDLSNADASKWKAEKIAILKDATGNLQPITTGVRIEIDQNNNVDRYLFIGTGKLLDQPDLSDTSVVNSLYVIKDGTIAAPDPAPATPYSRSNLTAVTATSVSGFGTGGTGRGWYQDATSSNQKINSDVYADVNIVVYAFSKPSADPCLAALTSTLYARDLATGNSALLSSSGTALASVDIGAGIAGVTLVQADPTASTSTPPISVQVTTMSGSIESVNVNLSTATSTRHRTAWGLVAP